MMQQVGNPVRDDARLAASRPGEDQQRTFQMLDGFALRRGKRLQQVVQRSGSRLQPGSDRALDAKMLS